MTELPKEVQKEKENGVSILKLTSDEDGKVYFFRKPGKKEMNRYLASVAKKKIAAATQDLITDLSIYPTTQDLQASFNEKPGMMVALSNALQEAVGLTEEFNVKKL